MKYDVTDTNFMSEFLYIDPVTESFYEAARTLGRERDLVYGIVNNNFHFSDSQAIGFVDLSAETVFRICDAIEDERNTIVRDCRAVLDDEALAFMLDNYARFEKRLLGLQADLEEQVLAGGLGFTVDNLADVQLMISKLREKFETVGYQIARVKQEHLVLQAHFVYFAKPGLLREDISLEDKREFFKNLIRLRESYFMEPASQTLRDYLDEVERLREVPGDYLSHSFGYLANEQEVRLETLLLIEPLTSVRV